MRLILAPLRIAADWLAHPTHGALACALRIDRDGSDPAPKAVRVVDATRDDRTARGTLPGADSVDAVRTLRVSHFGTLTADGQVRATVREGRVPLAITYEVRGDVTAADYVEALYILDGVAASLNRLIREDLAGENEAARTRLGVRWIYCETITIGTIANPRDDTTTLAALVVEPQLQDDIADTL